MLKFFWVFMGNSNSKVYFLFGIHNHQPAGNLDSVFEKAFRQCYLPFLSVFERFSRLKIVLHNSGALYDWAESRCPAWIEKIRRLKAAKRAELIGGGYYEPIFSIIPREDKFSQIRLMNDYLARTFGVEAKGCWVPERVWEPGLAKILNQSGFQYTYLDQAHFCRAQKDPGSSGHIYLTEEEGFGLSLFAIDGYLADKVPFCQPEEIIDLLISHKNNEDVLVTFFSDGEKFGLWPGSYDWVYKKKWLESFLSLLDKNPAIGTITSQEAAVRFCRRRFTYVGAAAYPKMEKWALDYPNGALYRDLAGFLKKNKRYKRYKKFIKGGSFKDFFIKYPRLNFMHKRMLFTAGRINSCLDPNKEKEAFLNLWKAQANCTYWHGIFGGFYLPHLRRACYRYLIEAESFLEQKTENDNFIVKDIDFDSGREIIAKERGRIYIFCEKGGSLDEFSLKDPAINLINTINRTKEVYHKQIRRRDFPGCFSYDNYKKTALTDHLLKRNLTAADFSRGAGIFSLAGRFYEFSKPGRKGKGFDFTYRAPGLEFKKKIHFKKKGPEAEYNFLKKSTLNNYDFGIEFNLSLSGPENLTLEAAGQKKNSLAEIQDLGRCSRLVISDSKYKIKIKFGFDSCLVYTNPVYTLSSSEAGPDILFQQLSIIFIFKGIESKLKLAVEAGEPGRPMQD